MSFGAFYQKTFLKLYISLFEVLYIMNYFTYHRDYTNRSASISLAIFDDRLELWNNGTLPPQLNIAALRHRHESYPRNKKIAAVFYDQGWVEGWGTGTTRMIGYCR